MKGMFSII